MLPILSSSVPSTVLPDVTTSQVNQVVPCPEEQRAKMLTEVCLAVQYVLSTLPQACSIEKRMEVKEVMWPALWPPVPHLAHT